MHPDTQSLPNRLEEKKRMAAPTKTKRRIIFSIITYRDLGSYGGMTPFPAKTKSGSPMCEPPRGAVGDRTPVQTLKSCAFYMLILPLVFMPGLGEDAQRQTLAL